DRGCDGLEKGVSFQVTCRQTAKRRCVCQVVANWYSTESDSERVTALIFTCGEPGRSRYYSDFASSKAEAAAYRHLRLTPVPGLFSACLTMGRKDGLTSAYQ